MDNPNFAETHTADTAEKPKNGGRGMSVGSWFLLASIIIVASIFGFALARRQAATQPTSGPAPTFSFTTFDNVTMKLEDLRGKVVVINFWASWCAPCRSEAPELQSAWEYYQDKEVVFLGIAYADNGPRSMAFLQEFGITYMNAPDLGTRISEAYHIQGVPETFVIDQDGNVAQFIYAGVTERQLRAIIDPLLESASS